MALSVNGFTEEMILDPAFRARVIADIDSAENRLRKAESFKRYEALKDHTNLYVLELLLRQFSRETVDEMQYALSNISIVRKIIDKLARVYSNGVKRTLTEEESTAAVEIVASHLHMNTKMKKLNKYLKLFRNTIAYVHPFKVPQKGGEDKYDLTLKVLPPHLYDAIEDPNNPEEASVFILSNYSPERSRLYSSNAAIAGRTGTASLTLSLAGNYGDGVDQTIADSPYDKDLSCYVWWSGSYHFTTNAKGEIEAYGSDQISVENPIGELPIVNFAIEQDGAFWAQGGADIADGGIRVNAILTHIVHAAVMQGYGQMYMTGKDLPKKVKIGPNYIIQLEHNEGDPVPQIGFISADPPISALMGLLEMYVALLLSTNNLSTRGFSTSLQGGSGQAAASGISLLIDKSESIEDVEDQAEVFRTKEPEIWDIIKKWHDVYKSRNALVDEMQMLSMPDDVEVKLQFPAPQTILSEKDELEILQMRRDMGLNTMVELIMRDDPSLDEAGAEEKLKKILEEKMAKMDVFTLPAANASAANVPAEPGDAGTNTPQSTKDQVSQEDKQQGVSPVA